MDIDDDFEDLFGEIDLLPDHILESFTDSSSDSMLDDVPLDTVDDDLPAHDSQMTDLTSLSSEDHQPTPAIDSGSRSRHELGGRLPSPCRSNQCRSPAMDYIEEVIEGITDQLLEDQDEIKIVLKRRPISAIRNPSVSKSDDRRHTMASRTVCFPGKSKEEAWRFAVVVRILELMHEALRNDTVLSKRDIFYRDPALFGKQNHVDRYVDDIAFTFGISRSSLNVTAAAKGLIAGCITFCRRDGTIVDAAGEREGQLVPPIKDILSVEMQAVKWILVIEKEASFRSITASSFWETVASKGIVVTGKGYPDVATRALLRFLSRPSPQNGFAEPPVYGLADFDPDGVAILSIYKQGSVAMSHENEGLCTPQLSWLGLQSDHIILSVDDTHASQGLLHLSKRDRAKARRMLSWDRVLESNVRRELQTMVMLNVKAELQLLDAVPDGMTNLLKSQLP